MTSGSPGSFDLQPDEEGEHITELQQVLIEQGRPVEATGRFDEPTRAALKDYGDLLGVYGEAPEIVAHINQNVRALRAQTWVARFQDAGADYGYQANIQRGYLGEEEAGNEVWATQNRTQTYYPDDATAQAEYGTSLVDGRLQYQDGTPVTTTGIDTQAGLVGSKPQRMIYTMDGDGEMRVADPAAELADLPADQRFHHSSLAGGQAVAGAGEIRVQDGSVQAVSDKSGHYKPDFAMTSQVNDRLADGGTDTSRVTYELGNFAAGGGATSDTLASGTEVGAYDRTAIVNDLSMKVWAEAQASAARKFGGAWSWLDETQKRTWAEQEYTPAMAQYEAMDDRALFAEGRKILEGRHENLRAVLAQIAGAMGWREDPFGRHTWRWFDGTTWTDRVYDDRNGEQVQGTDAAPFAGGAPDPGGRAAGGGGGLDPDGGYAPDPQPGGGARPDPDGGYAPDPQPGGGARPDPDGGYAPDPQPGGGARLDPDGGYAPDPQPGGGARLDPDGGYAPDPR